MQLGEAGKASSRIVRIGRESIVWYQLVAQLNDSLQAARVPKTAMTAPIPFGREPRGDRNGLTLEMSTLMTDENADRPCADAPKGEDAD